MLARLIEFIEKEQLFIPSDKILLAVSGGMDSIAMAELFRRSGLKYGIAHCNFQLRGEESRGDEEFVFRLAQKSGVEFYLKRFPTKEFAEQNGLSIQVAARELRYKWFEEIITEKEYKVYATAHHLDDQVETFLINLARGTGISGLHGILPRQGNLVRPMMFCFRTEIERFIKDEGLGYREDSSNIELKYTRNRIRHRVIPEIANINPYFADGLTNTILKLRQAENIYKSAVSSKRDELLERVGDAFRIQIDHLKVLTPLDTWVYELLSGFNFNAATVHSLVKALDSIPGKIFYSPTHRLIKDREYLIISEIKPAEEKVARESACFSIEMLPDEIFVPLHLKFDLFDKKEFNIPKLTHIASLDADKAKFPLYIRKWRKGDYFYPFGMKSKKKLSDYFIDHKFTLRMKEETWLLCSGDDIIWIIGHRIDERYKVGQGTKRILRIETMSKADDK